MLWHVCFEKYKLFAREVSETLNPIKLGWCIKELERIYGIRDGSAGKVSLESNNFTPKDKPQTEIQLANQLGITRQTLQNYKKLTELVPELQDWVETGILSPTTALAHD